MSCTRGVALVDGTLRETPFLVHTIWVNQLDPTQALPDRFLPYVRSWMAHHPEEEMLHVLWDGASAEAFLDVHFPDKKYFYGSLPTEVQQSDYLRLLLLFTYGGLYVDVDQECRLPFLPSLLRGERKILLLRSPLFTEEYTNCMMASLCARHSFWLDVATTVEGTVLSVREGDGLSRLCKRAFRLPLLGPQIQVLFTNVITGPSCLDRTIARAPLLYGKDVRPLPAADYYSGGFSVHHENGGWFSARTVGRVRTGVVSALCLGLFLVARQFVV